MLPVVAIIGRANVGKSTLFNCLTNSRAALVFDLPGTTIDRNYAIAKIADERYILVDTAGIEDRIDKSNINTNLIIAQINKAIQEATLVLLVMDPKSGITPEDVMIAKYLRKSNKKIILVINKIDGYNQETVQLDFFSLGFAEIVTIAAKYNRGINKLKNEIGQHLDSSITNNGKLLESGKINSPISVDNADDKSKDALKVAIVGQPNVGKSTLINNILGEERVVVQDRPGTTRDSIYIPATISNQEYLWIDTAGLRRKVKVKDPLEKFSAIKTLQAISNAIVVILLIDATKGLVEQDLKLIDIIVKAGRSLVVAVNKWDLIEVANRKKMLKALTTNLEFIDYIDVITISALNPKSVKKIFPALLKAYRAAMLSVTTNKLTLLLQQAIQTHQPPLSNGRRIKLRYAHLGGHLPYRIVIHGNQVESLSNNYKKYLSSFYQKELNLYGTPVHIICKNTNNPYVEKD